MPHMVTMKMDTDILREHEDDDDESFLSPGNFSSCDDADAQASPYRSRWGMSDEEAEDEDEMEGGEETTVFDRSVLLDSSRAKSFRAAGKDPTCKIVGTGGSHLSGVSSTPASPHPHRRLRYVVTFFLFASFAALGMGISILGPTLLDLAQNARVNLEQISSLFPARSIGYLFGSILGGILADVINPACAMALPLFMCSLATILIPWMTHTWSLGITMTSKGLAAGMLDTVGNVFCLRLWPDSPPAMQALHFFFGLGAFTAPLLAEPFLSTINAETPPWRCMAPILLFSRIEFKLSTQFTDLTCCTNNITSSRTPLFRPRVSPPFILDSLLVLSRTLALRLRRCRKWLERFLKILLFLLPLCLPPLLLPLLLPLPLPVGAEIHFVFDAAFGRICCQIPPCLVGVTTTLP